MRDTIVKMLVAASGVTRNAPPLTEETVALWELVLVNAQVDERWLQEAFMTHLAESPFFPAPADVINIVRRLELAQMERFPFRIADPAFRFDPLTKQARMGSRAALEAQGVPCYETEVDALIANDVQPLALTARERDDEDSLGFTCIQPLLARVASSVTSET